MSEFEQERWSPHSPVKRWQGMEGRYLRPKGEQAATETEGYLNHCHQLVRSGFLWPTVFVTQQAKGTTHLWSALLCPPHPHPPAQA